MPVFESDLEKAIASPFNRIVLDIDGEDEAVVAFAMEDTSFSFGNRFETPFESLGAFGVDQDSINSASAGVNAILGQITGQREQLAQTRLQHVLQTVAIWTGSDRFSFSLSMMFLATRPGKDVRVPIRKLIGMTQPTFGSELTIVAPGGYSGDSTTASGAIGIKIGRWFESNNIFLIRSLSPTISKTSTKEGLPLWATAQVQFEAYRMLEASEVQQLFSAGA